MKRDVVGFGVVCTTLAGLGLIVWQVLAPQSADPLRAAFLGKALVGTFGGLGVGGVAAYAGLGRRGALLLLARCVLVFVCLMLVAGLFEVALRIVHRDITTTGDFTSVFARRWREGVQHNSDGFRAAEFAVKAPGTFRIAVLGDSFAYGQGIAREARFSDRIEAALNADGGAARFEVLNFGQPGAATADETRLLREVVLPLAPDFVLLQWYRNDVEGPGMTGRPRPPRLIPSDYLSRTLHTHSALYYVANSAWQRLLGQLAERDHYAEYMRASFADPAAPGAVAAERALEDFIDTARKAGIPVAIATFPTLWGEDEFGYLRTRVLETCARRAVPCLDLAPVFARHGPPETLWVNRLDSHPGPRANALASEALLALFEARWRREAERAARAAAPDAGLSSRFAPGAAGPGDS